MPWAVKALVILVVAYALSPIDLIPDVIPVLGYLDELILLPALIALALRLTPAHVLAAARVQAQAWLEDRRAKPRSVLGVVLVVSIWMLVLTLGAWLAWVALRG